MLYVLVRQSGVYVIRQRSYTLVTADLPHSLQDIHHMKVKTKLHQLLFINTQPFNAAICQLEK